MDEVRGEMDFSKVIFLLLIKIHNASGVDSNQYIALVETFSDTLHPYHQNNGLDLGDAQKKYDAVINLADEFKGKKAMIKEVEMSLARAKFRALMVLSESKGLLLEKVSSDETWQILEDEDVTEEPKTNP